MPVRERVQQIALVQGGLLGVATFVLYAVLAPVHIVDGDNAEFATLGYLGGSAHPSGYPLYLLWLRAWQWLPGATPAHTAALATALIGAASVVMLHAACRAWGARPLAATVAAVLFAGAPIVIRSGTRAEVFALNHLIVAAVLLLSARESPLRGARRAAALGLVAGLGIANHLTCTLLAPVGILGAVRGIREATIPRAATVAIAVGALVIGLVPYVYLLVTPDTPLSWGTVRSLDELFATITRRDYGGPGAFLPNGVDIPIHVNMAALAATVARTWWWLPALLGLITLVDQVVRPRGAETRWGWAMLAISWVLAGPALATRFNIEPSGLGLYVIERFHLLPSLLLGVPVAVGLTRFAPYVERVRIRERTACAIAATLGLAISASVSLPHVGRMQGPALERYAQNVMRSLPPDAVLFVGQDGEYFAMNYVQWALGERPDVTLVSWHLTGMPWYGLRMASYGVYAPEGEGPAIVRTIDYLHSRGRPVFMEALRTTVGVVERTHPSHPFGPVVRILPRGASLPPVDEVFELNKAIYDRFIFDYPHPGEDDEFATAVHHRYATTWRILARTLAASGEHEKAAWAAELAATLAPRPHD